MKPTPKQILAFVESAGGIIKVMKALKSGATNLTAANEALTVSEAKINAAAELNQELQSQLDEALTEIGEKQTKIDEANELINSNVKLRKSGNMFKNSVNEDKKPEAKRRNPSKALSYMNKPSSVT